MHAAETPAPTTFETYELQLQHPVRQDAFVVPTTPEGTRSLIVAGVKDDGEAMMSAFPLAKDGSLPAKAATVKKLPAEVVALDTDGSSLYLLTPEAVWRWDPATDEFRTVAKGGSMFQVRPPNELIPIRFLRDADGDGDADLVLPDFPGYRVLLQDQDGSFTETARLRVQPIAHHQEYNRRITYRAVPLYLADADGDGIVDAMAVQGDNLVLFHGEGKGAFAEAEKIPLGLGLTERFLGDDVGDVDIDHTNQTWKRALRVRDFDGDGVVDVLAHRVKSTGLFDKQHSLELHRGSRKGSQLEFGKHPPVRVESTVVVDDPVVEDMDDDGGVDFSTWSVEFGVGAILGWLVTGTIDLDVSLYRLNAEGGYPERPSRHEEVEVAFDLQSGKPTLPPAFLADVNGDHRKDLILGGENEIRVFPGNGSADLFTVDAEVTKVRIPGNGRELVSAADVNGDGKDDLLVRYGHVDGEDLAKTMKVLIAE
ncbi:MAG: VCBS repeat-containing protein [Deltaproteobacteria bacterium]|nr:VCBS repeat-containing protein [Deltaproteobacteria bacterium]